MAGFRWIVTSSFLMLQVLSCRAASVKYSSFTVRDGDEVTLPCGNVTHDQDKCDSTNWLFANSRNTVPLFESGKIHKEAEDKSDRLSVSENCSLVIKKVTDEDAGYYICRQFRSGRHGDAVSDLSVVTMTEQKNRDEVTFICSVATYGRCKHTVKWMFEGNQSDVVTSQVNCSARLMIKQSHLDQKLKSYELLKCEVTDDYTGEVHQFPFSPPQSSAWWWLFRLIVVSLGLAALIITVVTVNIWTRTKVNKTRMAEIIERHEEEEEEEEEEDGGTVDYDDDGEPSASASMD